VIPETNPLVNHINVNDRTYLTRRNSKSVEFYKHTGRTWGRVFRSEECAHMSVAEVKLDQELFINDLGFIAADKVAVAMVDGSVKLFSTSKPLASIPAHTDSVRSIAIRKQGSTAFSGSLDKSIAVWDYSAEKVICSYQDRHEHGISVVSLYDDRLLFSGDDEGGIRLIDMREPQRGLPSKWNRNENSEYISDIFACEEQNSLLVTSGDGKLSVFDIRKQIGLNAMSDDVEDELLNVRLIKDGKKVVCGSQDGVLNFFRWGDFGDVCDRYPGHPGSIDCLECLSEDVILTGCSDGLIRMVHLYENYLMGIVGNHKENPIEALCLNHDLSLVASASHDYVIRFWNPSCDATDSKFDEDKEENSSRVSDSSAADDSDSEEDSNGSDSSSSEDDRPGKRKRGMSSREFSHSAKQPRNAGFFDDL